MARLTLTVCGVLMTLVLAGKIPRVANSVDHRPAAKKLVAGLDLTCLIKHSTPLTLNDKNVHTCGGHRQDLAEFVLSNYDKRVMPDEQVTINIGMMLRKIRGLDTEKGVLSLDVWFEMFWEDDRLAWNGYEKFKDLKELSLPASYAWIPDITLYNSPDGFTSFNKGVDVSIDINGSMTYVPPATFNTYCNLDDDFESTGLTHCTLKFGSWTHKMADLNPQLYKADIDLSDFVYKQGEWSYVNSTAVRNEKKYACCPDTYVTLEFELLLKYDGE